MGAQAQRKSDIGAARGAGIDWGDGVGKLTVGQCQAIAVAVESGLALAARLPEAASTPSKEGLSAVLCSSEAGVAPFIDALIAAMAAVTSRNQQWLRELPLDVFIDGVVAVFSALMKENTDYLAGPVSEALKRSAEIAGALQASLLPVPESQAPSRQGCSPG